MEALQKVEILIQELEEKYHAIDNLQSELQGLENKKEELLVCDDHLLYNVTQSLELAQTCNDLISITKNQKVMKQILNETNEELNSLNLILEQKVQEDSSIYQLIENNSNKIKSFDSLQSSSSGTNEDFNRDLEIWKMMQEDFDSQANALEYSRHSAVNFNQISSTVRQLNSQLIYCKNERCHIESDVQKLMAQFSLL